MQLSAGHSGPDKQIRGYPDIVSLLPPVTTPHKPGGTNINPPLTAGQPYLQETSYLHMPTRIFFIMVSSTYHGRSMV